jgi:hypothetical protein
MKTEVLGYSCVDLVDGPFLTREIESMKCSPKTEGKIKVEKKERKNRKKILFSRGLCRLTLFRR